MHCGAVLKRMCARQLVGGCIGTPCKPAVATSRQRHVCAVAASAALGGNLGGITSWLFSLDGGQLAAALRADIVVPVNGFKRCYDAVYGFGEWCTGYLALRHVAGHYWCQLSIASRGCFLPQL